MTTSHWTGADRFVARSGSCAVANGRPHEALIAMRQAIPIATTFMLPATPEGAANDT